MAFRNGTVFDGRQFLPDVQPTSLVMLSRILPGAVAAFAYMVAPRANSFGGTG